MNAHLLLQQLLEEYGIFSHDSIIDESVSEYVMTAMLDDSQDLEEKREFVRDVVLELSSLDEALHQQFLEDLIHAAHSLQQLGGPSTPTTTCPETQTETEKSSASASDTCSGGRSSEDIGSVIVSTHEEIHSSSKPVGKKSQRMTKGKTLFKNGQRVDTLSNVLSTGASSNTREGQQQQGQQPGPSCAPSPRDRTLAPLRKVLSKHLSGAGDSSSAMEMDVDVLSYIYEACIDPLADLEDKREVVFSCLPDLEQGGSTGERGEREEERTAVAREVVGVALHLLKLQQQASKNEARLTEQQQQQEQEEARAPSLPASTSSISTLPTSRSGNRSRSGSGSGLSPEAQALHAMLPHLDPRLVQFALEVKCLHDQQQAAQLLLEIATGGSRSITPPSLPLPLPLCLSVSVCLSPPLYLSPYLPLSLFFSLTNSLSRLVLLAALVLVVTVLITHCAVLVSCCACCAVQMRTPCSCSPGSGRGTRLGRTLSGGSTRRNRSVQQASKASLSCLWLQ
jgi:hypothetical protein